MLTHKRRGAPLRAHSDGSAQRFCCGLLLLACLGLVVAGAAVVLSALGDERGRQVNILQGRVLAWSSGARAEFDGLEVGLNVNGTSWHLRRETAMDWGRHADPAMPEYQGLYYVSEGAPLLLDGWSEAQVAFDFQFNATQRMPATSPASSSSSSSSLGAVAVAPSSAISSSFRVGPLSLAWSAPVHGNRKACFFQEKGVFDAVDEECVVFHQLVELCLKVYHGPDGRWALDRGGGGYGCHPGKDHGWSPTHYKKVVSRERPGWPPFTRLAPTEIDLEGIVVQVRSALDPLLSARNLTGDLLVLAQPGRVIVVEGLLLILVGVLISLPVLVFFCDRWRRPHTEEEEAAALFMAMVREGSSSVRVMKFPRRRRTGDIDGAVGCGVSCAETAQAALYGAAGRVCEGPPADDEDIEDGGGEEGGCEPLRAPATGEPAPSASAAAVAAERGEEVSRRI